MAGEDWTPPNGSTHVFRVPKYDEAADAPQAFKDFAESIDGGLGLDFEAKREGQVVQSPDGVDWAAGMSLRVVQDLPEDSEGEEGDVVFVLGDVPKAGGGSPAAISASNGALEQKNVSIDGKIYDLYTFTDDTRTDLSLTVGEPGMVDALLVGGGGGGGFAITGGAGGGAVIEGQFYLHEGVNDVVVGKGGLPSEPNVNNLWGSGYHDTGSVLGLYAAPGGAGSGMQDGVAGASGSGGRPLSKPGGAGTKGLGHAGGAGHPTTETTGGAGGGGGAGERGQDSPGGTAGKGGDGIPSFITGTEQWFGGGGGGGNGGSWGGNGGSGGLGGGANGSNGPAATGIDATPNTGGGAGGGGFLGADSQGGTGGSGIVIVRVEV